MTAVKLARVLALPDPLEPGTVYFVLRPDGETDIVVANNADAAVYARTPHISMIVEATPGLIPVNTSFGRFYTTEDMRLDAALSGMRADVAATNDSVFPVVIGPTLVARSTFAAGQAQAVVEILQPIVPAFSLIDFQTPVDQDPTLSGVVGTFGAHRI